jgi:hypothetical protein
VTFDEFDGGHEVPRDAARSAIARIAERHRVADVGNAARPDAPTPDVLPDGLPSGRPHGLPDAHRARA